jgi:transcriptional regulator with PAS, ATPase and Fis domain
LRVLQEEEIRKVGENKTIHVDVRVIAATAKDLKKELEKKLFREDIFFRLNGASIHIPPLRERKEDIPLLVEHFIKKYTVKGKNLKSVSSEFLKQLHNYHWPGNVRELENLIQRSVIMNDSGVLTGGDLPPDFNKKEITIVPFKKASRKLEKDLITSALQKTNGNRKEAAEMIGISYRSLMYKLKEYKIL